MLKDRLTIALQFQNIENTDKYDTKKQFQILQNLTKEFEKELNTLWSGKQPEGGKRYLDMGKQSKKEQKRATSEKHNIRNVVRDDNILEGIDKK